MRARNIKPGFFKNELLATSDPLFAWVYAGLWCLADRDGRLEDRPRRIHLEINPGRAYEGTVASIEWLISQGFLQRYAVNGADYLQIIAFDKHQNPHLKEPSRFPPPNGAGRKAQVSSRRTREPARDVPGAKHGASMVQEPDKHQSDTRQAPDKNSSGPADSLLLIPDSGSLIPDSGIRNPEPLRSSSVVNLFTSSSGGLLGGKDILKKREENKRKLDDLVADALAEGMLA